MNYEIEFIGVSKYEAKKDADCIALRWEVNGEYKIVVYDGGFSAHGEKLKSHIEQYYLDEKNDSIDAVICSHSDEDHAAGLQVILESFNVKALFMNRPWLYIDDVWDRVNDGRMTKRTLEKKLRDLYCYIDKLEKIAIERDIPIYECFEGKSILDNLLVLSPSKELYCELMCDSEKTPLNTYNLFFETSVECEESWDEESLREDVKTSAENEQSIILLGDMEEEVFLLTGDAGIIGLTHALDYLESITYDIRNDIKFVQIPHHGGRHNISPSVMDRLIGVKVQQGTETGVVAFVGVAEESDHPKKNVTNAFIRRGVKVYKTDGNIIRHKRGMPARSGWTSLKKMPFYYKVESWE